jgi:rRNA-processing protein FCF1
MRKVILDTSFIINCLKNKIDFIEELKLNGFELIIPQQVLIELKGLAKENDNAKLSLNLLKNNCIIKELKGKNTDKTIIKFAKENPLFFLATTDKEIQKLTKNPKIIIRGKNRIEII